jgi:hypothetical protein
MPYQSGLSPSTRAARRQSRENPASLHRALLNSRATCFIVRDANGRALSYVYYESEPVATRRPSCSQRDETRRIAVNVAKLPVLRRSPSSRLMMC